MKQMQYATMVISISFIKFSNLFVQPIAQTYIINITKTKLFVK
jgi:hypothetical protein